MRRLQTKNEEIANALTHGLGVLGAVTGLVLLVVFASLRGNAWSITGLSIFGAALTLLCLTSTLYHAIPVGRAKRVFRLLDHSMIFILIAGT